MRQRQFWFFCFFSFFGPLYLIFSHSHNSHFSSHQSLQCATDNDASDGKEKKSTAFVLLYLGGGQVAGRRKQVAQLNTSCSYFSIVSPRSGSCQHSCKNSHLEQTFKYDKTRKGSDGGGLLQLEGNPDSSHVEGNLKLKKKKKTSSSARIIVPYFWDTPAESEWIREISQCWTGEGRREAGRQGEKSKSAAGNAI